MKSYYKENFPFFLTFFINLLDHVSSSPCFPFEPLDRSLNYCSVRNIRKHHLFLSIQAAMAKYHKLGSYRQQIGEGNGTPLQYSCLKNPTDRGAWWAAVHGAAKSRIQLSDFPFTFHFHALEKEMATHSSIFAWRIPGMGEPGGLLSVGSHRVRHD